MDQVTRDAAIEAYGKEFTEVTEKAIAALRSGEYPQIKHRLRDRRGYCASGVVMDVSGLGRWDGPDTLGDYHYVINSKDGEVFASAAHVSMPVRQSRTGGYFFGTASGMNDLDGKTFDEIADIWELALTQREGWIFTHHKDWA